MLLKAGCIFSKTPLPFRHSKPEMLLPFSSKPVVFYALTATLWDTFVALKAGCCFSNTLLLLCCRCSAAAFLTTFTTLEAGFFFSDTLQPFRLSLWRSREGHAAAFKSRCCFSNTPCRHFSGHVCGTQSRVFLATSSNFSPLQSNLVA